MNENHKNAEKQALTPDADPSGRPSHRPSGRSEIERLQTPEPSGMNESLGSDSIPFLGIAFDSVRRRPVNSKAKNLSRIQLTEIEGNLTARDHAVLQTIRKYRFLTSTQVGNLFFTECTTKLAHSKVIRSG